MLCQIVKWGNSQGLRLPKKLLQDAGINLNDKVDVIPDNNTLIIKPQKKPLSWYLDGYDDKPDRYDWGADEPKGRELF
jgi:antitoxin MazE